LKCKTASCFLSTAVGTQKTGSIATNSLTVEDRFRFWQTLRKRRNCRSCTTSGLSIPQELFQRLRKLYCCLLDQNSNTKYVYCGRCCCVDWSTQGQIYELRLEMLDFDTLVGDYDQITPYLEMIMIQTEDSLTSIQRWSHSSNLNILG